MWILIITMVSTVGISNPIVLSGPPNYETVEQCRQAGKEVINWLTQDFIRVSIECVQAP